VNELNALNYVVGHKLAHQQASKWDIYGVSNLFEGTSMTMMFADTATTTTTATS
jgi:hypothetical protein